MDYLAWLGNVTENEEISKEDLNDGFPLLQLLSIISPSSVDLSWFTTQEALDCPNRALRNYVVLKKGLEFIKKNPPPTILHALSNNETLLNERLGEIKEEIDSLSEELVQEAKAGETAACLEILKLLHRIWKCCQVDKDVGATNVSKPSSPKTETRERAVEKIVEKNVEKKVEKKVVNSMKGPDDNEAYIPSERTFRPMVRWILKQLLKSFKMSNFHPSLALEVESLLNQCSDESKVYIPKNVIEAICQCQIYKFANFFLLQGEGFDFPSSLTTSDKPNPNDASLFLENLIQHKLLNINENMVSSVKDMIVDSTPFYESIHINIISAFMQSQLSETLDLEATVDYLEFVFPTFDRSVTYPYDLEDSLLLWINQCLISLKNQNDQVEGADDDDVELDDLVSTLDDAWMVAQVLQAYYPTETEKTNLKLTKFQKLHDMASRLNLFFVPWLPVDIKHNIGGPEGKSVYSGNSTGLFVCMLREFMVVVQNEKRKFPFVSDDTEDTVQQITQKNKQVTSVVGPKIAIASTLPIEAEESSALNEIQTEDIETTEKVVEMVNEENEMAEEVDEENDMNEEVKVENHFIETAHIDQETSLEKDIPREEKSLGLNIEQELLEIIKESESNENRNSSDINSNQEAVDDLNIHEIDKLEVTKQDSDDFVDKLSLSLAVLQTSELPSIDDIRSRRKIPAISTSNRADVSVDEGNNQNLSHRQAQAIPRLNRRTTNRIPIKARERVVLEPLKKIDPFPQKVKESIKIEPDNDPITVNTVFLSPPSMMIEAKKIFDSAIELETAKESTFLSKVNEKHDHQLVIKKEEEIVEEAAAAVEEEELSKNDEKSEMYEQSGHAEIPEGKIILSENALKMLLDDDDEESGEEDAPVFKNEGSVDTDGSDGEIDQETLDMINNIKNIEKKIEAKTSMNALEDEYEMTESSMQIQSQLQYDTLSENSEEPNVPETELDQPLNSNEMDILDFYESEPVTEVPPPKQAPLSRPRTGLQTYPIPENDQDQVETPVFDSQETTASAAAREEEAAAAWERAKRTPKGKTPNEQQTSTQETAPKKSSLETLQELKEKRIQQQQESKIKKQQEMIQKRREQAELQKKKIAEKEAERSALRNEMSSDQSKAIEKHAAPAAGPTKKNSASKRRSLSTKTNKNIIKNALMHVSLAGTLNKSVKQDVLQDLTESDAGHFVILFRDANNFSFRGLYFWDHNLDQTLKLYSGSSGPTELDPRAVIEFYKYDSGARTFKPIPTKSFGRSVDAVAIGREYFVPK